MNAVPFPVVCWLTHLQDMFGAPFTPFSTRCRRRHRDYGATIEALEARVCLSASAPALDPSAAAPATSTAQAKTIADYIYARKGNKQDAGEMQGLGGVALEGGGTDVIPALQWMIDHMGGQGDFLVLSATKDAPYNPYIFKLGGTNSVATLDIPSRAAAFDPAVKQIIESADALFITGGAQNDYLNFWEGTPVQAAIADDVARGVPIGGTSAGTAVLGQFIYSALNNSVTSAAALANPFNSDMTFDENFVSTPASHSAPALLPFLNNTLVDTHFITRDRTGRMIAFLARVDTNNWSPNDQPMGIGINEETALLITPDGQAQVVGNANATSPPEVDFFETPGKGTKGSQLVCQPDTPLTYTPILEETVLPGGTFNLSDWATSWLVNNAYTTHSTISVTDGVLTTTASASVAANSNALPGSAPVSLESVGGALTTPGLGVDDAMNGNLMINYAMSGLVFPEKKKDLLEGL